MELLFEAEMLVGEVGKWMQLVLRDLGAAPRGHWGKLSMIVCWVLILWMWILMKVCKILVQIDLSWEPD